MLTAVGVFLIAMRIASVRWLVICCCGLVVVVAAAYVWLVRAERDQDVAMLLARAVRLDGVVLQPGSVLSCLETPRSAEIERQCERVVFANPVSLAGALAYVTARIELFADANALGLGQNPKLSPLISKTQDLLELDQFGIAGHVLASEFGCTTSLCRLGIAVRPDDKKFEQTAARHGASWARAGAERKAAELGATVEGSSHLRGSAVPGVYWDAGSALFPPLDILAPAGEHSTSNSTGPAHNAANR
jgi:hypothetical protein